MCEKFHQLLAVGRWFPPGTPVSSTRKLISSSFHHLDMTLAVAEALTPNKPNWGTSLFMAMFSIVLMSHTSFPGVPMGTSPMHMVNTGEIGQCVRSILNHPDLYLDKAIGLSGDKLTVDQMVAVLNKALAPVKFVNANVGSSGRATSLTHTCR